jgi:hypothetical protein
MPQILELPELIEHHGVPKMQVRCGGVKAQFDPQRLARRLAALQLGLEFLQYEQLVCTPKGNRERMLD